MFFMTVIPFRKDVSWQEAKSKINAPSLHGEGAFFIEPNILRLANAQILFWHLNVCHAQKSFSKDIGILV